MYSCCLFESLSVLCVSGSESFPCSCPNEFRRYGSRCLRLLDQPVNDSEADSACSALGAHLAVPRSQEEYDMIELAASELQTGPLRKIWLGLFQHNIDTWLAGDGCWSIKQYFWALGQPVTGYYKVSHSPRGLTDNPGWHSEHNGTFLPLCQLRFCYRRDCPAN